MRKIYPFILVQCMALMLRAQHCPFDGSGLLVVAVKSADSLDFTADDLLVSLRDAKGQLIYAAARPMIFIKNVAKTMPERDTYDHNHIAYAFAGKNFILSVPLSLLRDYQAKGGVFLYANAVSGRYTPAVKKIKAADIYNIHYLNTYFSGQHRTEPVPENSEEPFRHLVRLTLSGPVE